MTAARPTALIPVLLYHSVSKRPPADATWGAVPPDEFEAHIDAVCADRRQALTASALADALRGRRELPARPVAITFDDGYADTFDAVRLLHQRGLASTVYVTTGALDQPGRLSRRQLWALAALPGVELGAHGVSHEHLDELPATGVAAELSASRRALEHLTGHAVRSFAYPHGAYDRAVRTAVIDAGYTSAAAVKNAICHPDDDPFAFARWTVTGGTSPARIAEVLDGRRVAISWAGERLRTRIHRAVRRRRGRLHAGRWMA